LSKLPGTACSRGARVVLDARLGSQWNADRRFISALRCLGSSLKSRLPGDCLSNQGRGITVGTAHIIKNPAWRSRNGVRGLEADVGGVTGCSSTSRHNPLKWILREWPVVRAEGRIDPAQLSANTTRQGRSYFVEFRLELRRLHHRLGGSATSHISEGSSRVQGCGDSR